MTDDKLAVWHPKEFAGNDLLPIQQTTSVAVKGIPLVGADHIRPEELVVPSLNLLQGQSDAVQQGVDGAKAGIWMHSGTEECFEDGPLRLIIVHHHYGNALFPKANNPDYADLETCVSRDAIEGTRYGLCETCRKCLDWRGADKKTPPLGAKVHHFISLTNVGPVVIRLAVTSYLAGSKLLTARRMADKNFFAHPVVVTVRSDTKTLPTGKKTTYYYVHKMVWQTTERVPDELQHVAYKLQQELEDKHEHGQLKTADGSEEFNPD